MSRTASREIKATSVWTLADCTEALQPDSATSAGAYWLETVRDAVIEAWEYCEDGADAGEVLHEVADSLVEVYTVERWRTFTDLGGWQIDISELCDSTDMTVMAGCALYEIARQVGQTLWDDLDASENDDDDEAQA